MIAAYAESYRVFRKDEAYRASAEPRPPTPSSKKRHLKADGGALAPRAAVGRRRSTPYLEDYALPLAAHGLLRLHAATRRRPATDEQARSLVDPGLIADLLSDDEGGGFFFTAEGQESLFARPKDPYDNALPGANSLAIVDLLDLASATGEARYRELAGKALEAFG